MTKMFCMWLTENKEKKFPVFMCFLRFFNMQKIHLDVKFVVFKF